MIQVRPRLWFAALDGDLTYEPKGEVPCPLRMVAGCMRLRHSSPFPAYFFPVISLQG